MALASRLCSASRRRIAGLNRIVVLLFQRRLLALRRSGRFLFRFGAGFFTGAVAFTQATKDLTRRYRCTFIFQNRIQNAVC
ncbi:hypothetical protein OIU92_08500 [Escherichia coli]|nr:hypothetical protein [Escherichia coli]